MRLFHLASLCVLLAGAILPGAEVARTEYDGEGHRIVMTVDGLPASLQSGPWETLYGYDRFGRLELLRDSRAHPDAFVHRYDPTSGLLQRVESPRRQAGQTASLRETRTYDNFGRLTSRTMIGSNNEDKSGVRAIGYDLLDRRENLTLLGGTLYGVQQTRAFRYDELGHLKRQEVGGVLDQEFLYDPIGNRLSWWRQDSGLVTYTPDHLNQYTAIASSPTVNPVYDLDGNLENDGAWIFGWNAESQLIEAELPDEKRLRFGYDGLGRRVSKTVDLWDGGSWTPDAAFLYTYDGRNLIARVAIAGGQASTLTTYIWGLDLSGSLQGVEGVGGLLAETRSDGLENVVALATYDANGNIIGYLDPDTEELVAEFSYGPFGETVAAVGLPQDSFQFRFSTKYHDTESGLTYYGHRYYDPAAGRWLNRDPAGEAGGLNLYGFNLNDPVNYIDPDGQAAVFGGIAGGIIGGGVSGTVAYIQGARGAELAHAIAEGAIYGAAYGATMGMMPAGGGLAALVAKNMAADLAAQAALMALGYQECLDLQQNQLAGLFGGTLERAMPGLLRGLGSTLGTIRNASSQATRLASGMRFAMSGAPRQSFLSGPKTEAISLGSGKPGVNSAAETAGSKYQRMRTAAKFLNENKYFDGTNWKSLSKPQRRDIFAGIDFSKPLNVRTLDKGTALVQDVRIGGTPGPWFRSPGTSASEIGLWAGGRQPVNFRTRLPTQVLETRARPILDTWSQPGVSVPTQGGGIQYYTFQGYKIWPE